jgi:hypothetical protein
MRFPHDVTLLDEARRKSERIIDTLHERALEGYEKPRTYRKTARKEFLTFMRNRKPRGRMVRKALKKQLQYVERNLRIISDYKGIVGFKGLSGKQYRDLVVISELVRLIARGKARGMYEFGAKLSVSLVDGLTEVHRISWEPYNESKNLRNQIELKPKSYQRP